MYFIVTKFNIKKMNQISILKKFDSKVSGFLLSIRLLFASFARINSALLYWLINAAGSSFRVTGEQFLKS